MIKAINFSAAFILLAATLSFGQNDSTRYINGLPVSEDDTARTFPQRDIGPKEAIVAVPHASLPADLSKSLDGDDIYAGWKDTTVYYDANTNLYLIHIKTEESLKVYGLNDKGKPVTFREVNRSHD